MSDDRSVHVQQTFLSLGDEFFLQYLISADTRFRGNQILSRLFSMGHSLELYLKAALTTTDGAPPTGHNVPEMLRRVDPSLLLAAEELEAGEKLFSPEVSNVDLGLWMQHAEALELYQAEYFVTDLKYYLRKDQRVIFPARMSLAAVNTRYLGLVGNLRRRIPHRTGHHDSELIELAAHLGFEPNPALNVV